MGAKKSAGRALVESDGGDVVFGRLCDGGGDDGESCVRLREMVADVGGFEIAVVEGMVRRGGGRDLQALGGCGRQRSGR